MPLLALILRKKYGKVSVKKLNFALFSSKNNEWELFPSCSHAALVTFFFSNPRGAVCQQNENAIWVSI